MSVSLFAIVINKLLKCVNECEKVVFEDDLTIFVKGKSVEHVAGKIQRDIDRIAATAKEIGFTLSV